MVEFPWTACPAIAAIAPAHWTAALPAFAVTLREGFEAALVVGIVLACLNQAGADRLRSWVGAGVAAGLLASAAVGALLLGSLQGLDRAGSPYAPLGKELLEAGLGFAAIALLGWMLVWMTGAAKGLSGEVKAAVGAALDRGGAAAGWSLFGLVAIAVLREGFETVVFLAAQFQEGLLPVLGAIAGLLGAVALGTLLFRWGIRIDVGRFFQVMGLVLLAIVAGLAVGALKHLEAAAVLWAALDPAGDALCWAEPASCLLGPQVWDWSAALSDRAFPGLLLKTLLGYRDRLYALQAIGYLLVWAIAGGLYFRSLNARSLAPRSENSRSASNPTPDQNATAQQPARDS